VVKLLLKVVKTTRLPSNLRLTMRSAYIQLGAVTIGHVKNI